MDKFIAIYARYYNNYREQFETLESAIEFLYYLEEHGDGFAIGIVSGEKFYTCDNAPFGFTEVEHNEQMAASTAVMGFTVTEFLHYDRIPKRK